jgi:hypothetical protein
MRYKEFAIIHESGPATTTLGQDLGMSGSSTLNGVGRYSAQDDNVDKMSLGATRKPKVTLKMLNKLKMIRSAKKLEILQKSKLLGIIYAPPSGDASP